MGERRRPTCFLSPFRIIRAEPNCSHPLPRPKIVFIHYRERFLTQRNHASQRVSATLVEALVILVLGNRKGDAQRRVERVANLCQEALSFSC